jgi:tRNA threonylcarbamoyladenosine biosynthesis protein TsaE
MATLISNSPAETFSLGEEWGRHAEPGWVIGLIGELGAGKTELVKGLAKGLDIPVRVHSPTFALVNEYRGGRLPLFHLDLYRIDTPGQIRGAGLEEYCERRDGVVVIEWFERWPFAFCAARGRVRPQLAKLRQVHLEELGRATRRISYEDSGS